MALNCDQRHKVSIDAGLKIAVIGAGISNRPLIRWLWRRNQNITVFDRMEKDDARLIAVQKALAASGCDPDWSVGAHYLDRLHGFDLIFRTPGLRPDTPELLREREKGACVTSEIAFFIERCPAPIYAVTGSDGKTTTTTLISRMFEKAGYPVLTGGNIGEPLIERVDEITPSDRVVLELSSFQLMDMAPRVRCAVITNVTPNHLDYHKDFHEYVEAKKNIFRHQPPDGRLILNAKDPVSQSFMAEARGDLRLFNAGPSEERMTAWEQDGALWLGSPHEPPTLLCRNRDLLVFGAFNRLNIQAAALAVASDAPADAVREAARTFAGIPHRLERIREKDGVAWYNSSIDSSPTRTIHSLEAMRELGRPLLLIMGGKDKKSDYTGLGAAVRQSARAVILCGENRDLILDAIRREKGESDAVAEEPAVYGADTYEEAVRLAQNVARQGDAVLLTPAGTSFDRFQNFEARGDSFRQCVLAL